MRTQFLMTSLVTCLLSGLYCAEAKADALAGFKDVTVVSDAIVSLRYGGTEYVVANGDLMLGTTTRWYIPAGGVATQWVEGDPAPAATNNAGSPPKPEDPGSEGDNFYFRRNGANNMSSIDAIDFQETIFPTPTDTIFVFERGGNDTGTYQAILQDGTLGPAVSFVPAANGGPYADTGVDVAGQHAFGVVFTTDARVKGVRITAPGHDCLSISAIPKPLDPKQSHEPQPADGATDVRRDVALSWMPGEDVATTKGHIVYLSANLNDIASGLGGVALSATTFDAGRLEFGTTYYWRVDEVGAGAGAPVYEGAVWSFTTEAAALPIQNVTATASGAQAKMGPENTVNGSGLNADDQHSTEAEQMWFSDGAVPNWIRYEFDRVYKLHELWVWNSNQAIEGIVGFGARDVRIDYSLDGDTWTELAGVPEFAQATGAATYTHDTTVPFGGVLAKYVRLTIDSSWGGLDATGLSEVRFFYVPVHAREPLPADEATDVDLNAVLSWRPGREAVSHVVYLGQDADAVAAGTAPATIVAPNNLNPGGLEFGATYCWRVDEVNEAMTPSTYEGSVWSFTTREYEVVDDFESYTDDEGSRIYETWVDGYTSAENGSRVGYIDAPFAERAVIHGGRQSMPLFYDNTGAGKYSEAERTFDTSGDWTRAGITTLAVHFRGDPNNTGGQLYLRINGVKVPYGGEAAALTSQSWTRWDIDLASVGTNLTKVTRLAIGLDSGGAGVLYVDDIRLLPADSPTGPVMTVGPAQSVLATGDDGAILSINGIDVSGLVLATTTADYEKYPDHPAAHADDFDLATYASLDEAQSITVLFAVPVTAIFIVERGANDLGQFQPLDAKGKPLGGPQAFEKSHWFKPGVKISGQDAGAIVIESTPPIYGIVLLPPAGGVTGIDPASISGVPAQ